MRIIDILPFKQPRAFCSWLFLFIISTCLGQTSELSTETIFGSIKSDIDSVGIEGAHIYIRNSAIGTITNAVGEFEIKIPSNLDLSKTEIVISAVGYKTKILNAEDARGKIVMIYLESVAYLLDEVVVRQNQEDSSVYILNKAIHAIQFNYPRKNHLLEGFYRAVSTCDTSYTRLIEAAIRVQEVGYQKNTWDKESLTMIKNRINVVEIRKSDDYREKDFFSKAMTFMFGERNQLYEVFSNNYARIIGKNVNHVMSKNNLAKLESVYNSRIEWDGKEAYSISLKTKASGFSFDEVDFLINKADFAILKMELKRGVSPNVKDLSKDGFIEGKYFYKSEIIYRKVDEKKYYPVFIHAVGSDQGTSFMGKVNGKEVNQSVDQIFLLTNVFSEDFAKVKWKDAEDRNADLYKLNLPYNENFWKNYNTVKLNPLKRNPVELQKNKSLEEQFKQVNKDND